MFLKKSRQQLTLTRNVWLTQQNNTKQWQHHRITDEWNLVCWGELFKFSHSCLISSKKHLVKVVGVSSRCVQWKHENDSFCLVWLCSSDNCGSDKEVVVQKSCQDVRHFYATRHVFKTNSIFLLILCHQLKKTLCVLPTEIITLTVKTLH